MDPDEIAITVIALIAGILAIGTTTEIFIGMIKASRRLRWQKAMQDATGRRRG
jgi:hypothetical protein